MKQRIEPEQLAELTPEKKEHLRELWKPQIGDMFYIDEVNYEGVMDRAWLLIINNKRKKKEKRERYFPLLSIGQMIEILSNKNALQIDIYYHTDPRIKVYKNNTPTSIYDGQAEICNSLWEAVKEVL